MPDERDSMGGIRLVSGCGWFHSPGGPVRLNDLAVVLGTVRKTCLTWSQIGSNAGPFSRVLIPVFLTIFVSGSNLASRFMRLSSMSWFAMGHWPLLLAAAAAPGVDSKRGSMQEFFRQELPNNPNFKGWPLLMAGLIAGLGILITYMYTTRAGVIARATMKEALRQPVFLLLLILSAALLVVNNVIPFYSLGDDVKMVKDCGLATILISGLILALWTASTSISDEIEGKTAMTLLSKPINRRQFIFGKYLGIVSSVLVLMIPLSILLLALIYHKVGYDARESSTHSTLTQAMIMRQVAYTIPGIVLSFFEIAILTAISVAISTRVPMAVNMVTCFTVFVVGHLTPELVASGAQSKNIELVLFFARVIASVLPSLEVFKIDAHIATDTLTSAVYVAWSGLYALVYSLMAILLAFFLFEDRDLA